MPPVCFFTVFRTYLIYKPFGMLSQFSREGEAPTLADLDYVFPKDVYPVGRLDADSEGLLLLTNNNALKTKLLEPRQQHRKTYYVQVEGIITPEACRLLNEGVLISVNGKKYQTLPANCEPIAVPVLPARNPPVRYRKAIPDTWMMITLTEGKNRQVRRMTASVGFPTLRLVRVGIGAVSIGDMQPGAVKQLQNHEINALLL